VLPELGLLLPSLQLCAPTATAARACRCAKPASPNGMYSCRYCAAAGGPYVARWFNWLKEISEADGLPANHTLKNPAFGGSTSGMGMPALAWCCAEALLCCCCLL